MIGSFLGFSKHWIQTDAENLLCVSDTDLFLNRVYAMLIDINGSAVNLEVNLGFIDAIPNMVNSRYGTYPALEEELFRKYPVVTDGRVNYLMDLKKQELKMFKNRYGYMYPDSHCNKFIRFLDK